MDISGSQVQCKPSLESEEASPIDDGKQHWRQRASMVLCSFLKMVRFGSRLKIRVQVGTVQPPTTEHRTWKWRLSKGNLQFHVSEIMIVYIYIFTFMWNTWYFYTIYTACVFWLKDWNHKFARPRFAKRRTCPSNAHWSWSWDAQRSLGDAKSQGSFPPPLEDDGSRIFFQIISFGNEALQKIGEVIVFFFFKKKHFLGIIFAFLHGES